MASIQTALEEMFKTRNVPIEMKELADKQYVFSGGYKLGPDKVIPFHVVARDFNEGSSVTEYQITYRKICQVEKYEDTTKALQVINELNQKATGYYTLVLAGDGEIYLRLLSRTTEDTRLLYEIMVFGSATARRVYPLLEQRINGKTVEIMPSQTPKQ